MRTYKLLNWLAILALLIGVLPAGAASTPVVLAKPAPDSTAAPATSLPFVQNPIKSTAPTSASTWCVAGSFQPGGGWDNGSTPLYDDGTNGDLVAGDGIYSLDYAVAKAAGYYEWKVFSCGTWNGYSGEEGDNKWLYTTTNPETVKFIFDTNTLTDGYKPSTNMANVVDSSAALTNTWTAVGDWQGWDQNSTATIMNPIAPGLYAVTYTVASAGAHMYKATETGSWSHQFGPDGRSVNSGNYNFTTTSANQVVGFYVDTARGRINAVPAGTPGTANWYLRGTMNGWSGTQDQLYDDGTHGDLVAGDGVYSLDYTFPSDRYISVEDHRQRLEHQLPQQQCLAVCQHGQPDRQIHARHEYLLRRLVAGSRTSSTPTTIFRPPGRPLARGKAGTSPTQRPRPDQFGDRAVRASVIPFPAASNYTFKVGKTGNWKYPVWRWWPR